MCYKTVNVQSFYLKGKKDQWNSVAIVQSISCVWLFVTPWTSVCQASLSFTISLSLLKLMSIESVMPSNHLILRHCLLLSPSIFPRIKVFSNESDFCIRWPKDWSFSFSTSPSNEYSGLISFRIDWFDLLDIQVKSLSRVWLFATPWTIAYQAPQSMEFSRQEYWSGLPFPPPGDLPDPGIEPGFLVLQADALLSDPPRDSQ